MNRIVCAAVLAGCGPIACAGPAFDDDFDSYAVGQFPGGVWQDMGTYASPAPPIPSGEVIDTIGRDGQATRAFRVFQTLTTSQGLIAPIDEASTHHVEADLRVDAHPDPAKYLDWTAAVGLFDTHDHAADINAESQGVLYVYQERWWFYGQAGRRHTINTQLADAPVVAGEWYRVSLSADTRTGEFALSVLDASGASVVDARVAIPGYAPALGRYDRLCVFDGEYATQPVTPGQFTVDNVAYTPAPGAAAALLVAGALGAGRARRRG